MRTPPKLSSCTTQKETIIRQRVTITTTLSGAFALALSVYNTVPNVVISHGDTAFFITDTRRYRSDPTTTEDSARTMLGDKQLSALHSWLSEVRLAVCSHRLVKLN